ncbi:MlaD family protein [Candidatus Omnitrophota bacterium]
MIFGKTKLELKVGVFVCAGLVILVIFVLSLGNFKTWASGYRVNFIFDFVNGVKRGAPVRFAGVEVGEVKEINFISEAKNRLKVQVVTWIEHEVNIPVDSTVWVNTLGLLGEKYIEIMPGDNFDDCLSAGQSLVGVDPLPMHEMVRFAKGIGENLNATLLKVKEGKGTVGRLLNDESIYNELEGLMTDLRKNPWKLLYKSRERR